VLVGAQRLLNRFRVPLGPLAEPSDRLIAEGKTLIFVAADGPAVGLIAAADAVRPSPHAPLPN
jgi:cation transport ATPase